MNKSLKWQIYPLLVKYHWRFLLLCSTGGLVLGIILNSLVLHPSYTSHAKLLIKGGKAPTFVTPLQSDSEPRALTNNGNPLLTQIEVLNSFDLSENVITKLKTTLPSRIYREYQQLYPSLFEVETLAEKPKFKNPPNTDIVSLQITTGDGYLSKTLMALYITSYKDFLQQINRETLRQQGQYIRNQIKTTEDKLKDIRQKLMQYRKQNGTVNLVNEAEISIKQLADLETERINIESQISARTGTVGNLRSLLGMSPSAGIKSVALGMNPAITEMQKALNETKREYQTLSVKYTDENPVMQSLKAKIVEISKQIQHESEQTVSGSSAKSEKLIIADPVRSNLVNNLATSEAELKGLIAHKARLTGNLNQLKVRNNAFPEKQFEIAELLDSEEVLSGMVNLLRQKAAEAELQAYNELSNVIVIESATLPKQADTPRPSHILALMMLIGALSGMTWLVYREWFKIQALKPVEEHLKHQELPVN